MNSRRFLLIYAGLSAVLCLPLPDAVAVADDTLFEDGPAGPEHTRVDTLAPWQELNLALPPYPQALGDLIELNISTAGLPYRLYLDPASLSTGEDRVVRFTSVMVSSAGFWNVTYEGLHCGERNFRRFAYGIDGRWHPLKASPWRRIAGHGVNQYRKQLYEDYLCDTTRRYKDADELVHMLRYGRSRSIIED